MRIFYKRYEFGGDRPVRKGALLGEKRPHSTIYFLIEKYSWHSTPNTVCALLTSSTIFCDQSVTTATLFVEQRILTAV